MKSLKPNQVLVVNELKEDIERMQRLGMPMSLKDISDWLTECNQNTLKGLAKAGVLSLVSKERIQLPTSYNGYWHRCYTDYRYILTPQGQQLLGIDI